MLVVSAKRLDFFEKSVMQTHKTGLKNKITELPAKVRKRFYKVIIKNGETVEIWSLVNSKFVVYYSSTGEMFLFTGWVAAKEFRKMRVENIRQKYSLYR